MERKCSAYTVLEGVATEVVPEKSLTTRHTGFYQEYLPETASSGQAAYHSIVQPYICRDTRVPRSHLGAVSLLVSAPAQLRITATMVTVLRLIIRGLRISGPAGEEGEPRRRDAAHVR